MTLRLTECAHFVSNELKEDVASSRYNMYLAREKAIKRDDLVGISNFSTVGPNPMKILSGFFFCFQNRIRDPLNSIE